MKMIEMAEQMMDADLGHIDPSIIAQSCQTAMVYAILVSGRDVEYLNTLIKRQRLQFDQLNTSGIFEDKRERMGLTGSIEDPDVRCDHVTAMALMGTKFPKTVH